MTNPLQRAFDAFLPPAEELWERGGAELRDIEIEPGRTETVPFFDLEITNEKEISIEPFEAKRSRHHRVRVGRQVVKRFVLSDGVDRVARVIELDDKYRTGADVTVTDGTAWTTTIDGYAHDRARRIAQDAHLDVIQVGSEHSGTLLPYGLDVFRLGRTVCDARAISLAKSAQAEQLIVNKLTVDHGLASSQYAIGDSRGSMKTPGQYPYADYYGHEIVHMDTKAPCVPERLGVRDMPRVIRWFGREALGGAGVIAQLVAEGKATSLRGTTSLNPNFVASSVVGIMPALASGEAGRMADWVPRDAYGHVVVYGKDGLSPGDVWRDKWQQHPGIYIKVVPNKVHAHLLEGKAHDLQVGRIRRFSQAYDGSDNDLARIDWQAVYRPDHGFKNTAEAA